MRKLDLLMSWWSWTFWTDFILVQTVSLVICPSRNKTKRQTTWLGSKYFDINIQALNTLYVGKLRTKTCLGLDLRVYEVFQTLLKVIQVKNQEHTCCKRLN